MSRSGADEDGGGLYLTNNNDASVVGLYVNARLRGAAILAMKRAPTG